MKAFDRFSQLCAEQTGKPSTFIGAIVITCIWLGAGPLFGWSDTWQLLINTSTTILTWLMLFLLQATQNRDTQALHAKLDELIHATKGASDELIRAEECTEDEIEEQRLDPCRDDA